MSLALLGLIILNSLNATRAAELKDSLSIPELTVTADKPAYPNGLVSSARTDIDAKTIENNGSYNLLPVLSAQVPGLFLTERGIAGYGVAQGAAGGITIRGVGSNAARAGDPLVNNQVLFLLNGQPQIMGLMGHPISDILTSDQVARVEVIRGPASVLYGPNAMGGAINIITKKQEQEGFRGNLGAQFGAYNTQNYTAHAMFQKGKWNAMVYGARQSSDGYLPHSGFENNQGSISLAYRVSDHLNINTRFEMDHFKSDNPDTIDYPKWVDVTRGMASVQIDNNFRQTHGSLIIYTNFGEHTIADGFHSTDQSSGVRFVQNLKLSAGDVSVGADYLRQGGFAENPAMPPFLQTLMNFPLTKYMDEASVYALAQHQLFTPGLQVNAGLRYSYNSIYGGKFLPQAGLNFRLNDNTGLKALISKGYRGPTIKELYLFPPHNDTLKAEDVLDYEISWNQKWFSGKLNTELTVFQMKGSNLIRQIGPKLMNTGEFNHSGLEAMLSYQLCAFASLNANYSYLYMENPVPAAPVHQFNASVNLSPVKNLQLNLGVQNVNGLYLRLAPESKEDYTLVNVNARYRLYSWMELSLIANNLLSQEYNILPNFPMPPANFTVGIKFLLNKQY